MKKLALLLVLALALVPVLAACNNGEVAETETETEAETVFVPEELSFTDLYKTDYALYWAKLDREIMEEISADPNAYRVSGQEEYDYSDIWELATEKNFDPFFGGK